MSIHSPISSVNVNGGFYTVREAARLLGMENGNKIARWLAPTAGKTAPVVVRDYKRIGAHNEVSFLDLVELRFVLHFRRINISLQSLRIAAKNARDELKCSHPFATSNVKFQTDRRQIFLDTARETGDHELLNLMTKQVAIYDVIEQSFARDLEFDVDGLARLWRPAPADAPNVMVAPVFAFGKPVISQRRVPTRAIFDSWLANEHENEAVAEWFDIEPAEVEEAIRFELRPLH